MALFKALSGNRANLPEEKRDGYVYFCENDGSLHFDYKDAAGVLQREQINAKDAETLCGMTLDEIKTYVTVQPDWAQTNSAAADYIKNKPNVVTEEVFNEEINKRPIAYPAVIEDGVIIEPGKKIDASLIDAEWLATSIKADLDITISNKNADSFEVIEVLGVPMMTKLSDTVPTLEQLKSSIITITASDGASQEIKITTDMIVQDPELIGNAYIVYDMLLICDKEVTDPDLGVTLNKGIYLGETIPGALEHFGATSINLYIPDGLSSINLLPEKFIPDTIARVSDVENVVGALAPVATTGSYNDLSDKPEYSILLKDVDTSYRYNVFIKNGTLTTSIACASIRVDSIPDKEYAEGDKLDLSDAVVIAIGEDGSERQVTGFTYPETVPSADNPEIIIYYTEFGRDFTAMIELPVKSFADSLIDFEYTVENDGTYTLTAWKETLNGEPSTELIIPEDRRINV